MRISTAAAFALLMSLLPIATASAQTASRLSLRLAELAAQRAMEGRSSYVSGSQLSDPVRPVIGVQLVAFNNAGLLITGVSHGSPAQLAGLEAGDMIVGINDYPVASRVQYDQLLRIAGAAPKFTIRNVRDGKFDYRWIPVVPESRLYPAGPTVAPAYTGYSPHAGFSSSFPVLAPDTGLNPYDDSPQTYRYHQGLRNP